MQEQRHHPIQEARIRGFPMSTKGTRITHNASNKLTTLVGAVTVPTEAETSFSLTYSHRHGPNNRILLAVFRHAPREHLRHRDGAQGSRHSGNTTINLTIEVSRRQGQSHIAAPLMPYHTYTESRHPREDPPQPYSREEGHAASIMRWSGSSRERGSGSRNPRSPLWVGVAVRAETLLYL
jgi:hypothetical protein